MKISKLQNDTTTEDEGKWEDLPGFPDVRVLARSVNSRAYQRLNQQLIVKFRKPLTIGGKAGRQISEQIEAECLRHAGIVDWQGVTDDDKNPLDYESNADGIFGTADGLEQSERQAIRRRYADFINACRLVCNTVGSVDRVADDAEDEVEAGKGDSQP